jgi:hypothetical protein
MKLIESKTLGTAAASIEFTSIPQTFTDLVVVTSLRSDRAGNNADTSFLRFNGTTTGYSTTRLFGNGSTVTSDTFTFASVAGVINAATSTANTFDNSQYYIPNYTSAVNKTISMDNVQENNATAAFLGITANLWSNTAAITSITVIAQNGNLLAGSTISLYGITKGSDGIVTTS